MSDRLTAPEAERAVIEFALESTADWPGFRELQPHDFSDATFRAVWEAAVELAAEGTDPGPPAVATRLKERGRDGVAEQAYKLAAKVMAEAPDPYIETLRDRSARRRLVDASRDVAGRATDFGLSVTELMDTAERSIMAVADRSHVGGPVPVKDRIMYVVGLIEGGGFKGVPTGFRDLDAQLTGGGLLPGQMVVVAGGTSMGKTAWCTGLAAHVGIQEGQSVGYCSIEMTKDDNTLRLVCHEARADIKAVCEGGTGDHDLTRIANASTLLNKAPIYLEDEALTVSEVRSTARRLKVEHGLRVLIVDHIQDMEHRADNRREQLGGISRGLKQLAKELGITVVAVSQLSRGMQSREDPRPRLSDLKESGDIENSADVVLMLHRPEYYSGPIDDKGNNVAGQAAMIIAKQRNGPTGTVPLTWVGHCARFDDAAWEVS